ncbi:hypothetical protein Pcinc_027771 [Petrolisthes cinctipes]|uniref:Peptidase S1 domain-containing protein n=1 Tax=Petrolisthes cinctipes TaxID=88211 RepID=A0AAE1K865_PETCI|nr:hypothetical protein Pcinc_027771 [Petrolisthes cinctipes]
MKNVEARIIGGEETTAGEWPWQVALVHAPSSSLYCGASLINLRFLLTAAHCASILPMHQIEAWLGGHDLSKGVEEGRVVRKISRVIIHNHHNRRTLANDLALLRMDQPVNNTRTVRPVCLPEDSKPR